MLGHPSTKGYRASLRDDDGGHDCGVVIGDDDPGDVDYVNAPYEISVNINNQSASNGSLTESFIRSRASLSPSYFHNEISTRYNMISAIPLKLTQLKKSIEKFELIKTAFKIGITIAVIS